MRLMRAPSRCMSLLCDRNLKGRMISVVGGPLWRTAQGNGGLKRDRAWMMCSLRFAQTEEERVRWRVAGD